MVVAIASIVRQPKKENLKFGLGGGGAVCFLDKLHCLSYLHSVLPVIFRVETGFSECDLASWGADAG